MVSLREVIHGRELDESQLRIRIVVGRVEKKGAASLLKRLSEEFPLQRYNLGHLKRARSAKGSRTLEIVVCTENDYDSFPSEVKDLLEDVKLVDTYSVEPASKEEHERWCTSWPIHYRPSDLERSRLQGCSQEQLYRAEKYMHMAEQDANSFSSDQRADCVVSVVGQRGGIVVNPDNGKVIITSHATFKHLADKQAREGHISGETSASNLATHPLYTAAMLCIHGVAEVVLGNLAPTEADAVPSMAYLCTGLDFFLMQEPDLTSSMALVHSRIRTLTFRHVDAEHGALQRHYRLHDMRALNHRFRAYVLTHEETKAETR